MVHDELLELFPSFKAGGQSPLQRLDQITQRVEAKAGAVLFERGETSDRLFVIIDGEVEVRRAFGKGPEVLVDLVTRGGLIGWSALSHPHVRRSACKARTDVTLFALEAHGLRDLCDEIPDLGFELMRVVSQTIARRLEGAWQHVDQGTASA